MLTKFSDFVALGAHNIIRDEKLIALLWPRFDWLSALPGLHHFCSRLSLAKMSPYEAMFSLTYLTAIVKTNIYQ